MHNYISAMLYKNILTNNLKIYNPIYLHVNLFSVMSQASNSVFSSAMRWWRWVWIQRSTYSRFHFVIYIYYENRTQGTL